MLFPVVLPLLALGTIACLARGRGGSRSSVRPTDTYDRPSPLTVMGAFLYMGERPPQSVILQAIAQAESIGRADLVDDIVRAFVLPAVLDAKRDAVVSVRDANACPVTDDMYPTAPPPVMYSAAPPTMMYPTSPPPVAYAPTEVPAMYVPTAAPAMYVPTGVAPAVAYAPTEVPAMYVPTAAPMTSDSDTQRDEAQRVLAEVANAGGRAAKVELLPRPSPATDLPETITVSGKSSPIDGVGTGEWSAFVDRVSRESPTFTAAQHVGQFRQRRERLTELGIDPSSIVDKPAAQLAALDADMGDAYHHACASGLVEEYLGRVVDVSSAGEVQPAAVTLSGVLGVIQAAGLEGAVQWLEQPADRARFPNTTQAFLRCNGVF